MSHILSPFVRGVRVDNGEWVIGTVVRMEQTPGDNRVHVFIDDTRDLSNIKSYEIKGWTWGQVAKVSFPGMEGLSWTGEMVRKTLPDGTYKTYVVELTSALTEIPEGDRQIEEWHGENSLNRHRVSAILKNGPEGELSYLYDDVVNGGTGEKWELHGEPLKVPAQD